MALAILFIIFKGSTSDGQTGIFDSISATYIEETSASTITITPSQNQTADINSVFAYSNDMPRTAKPSILSMIQNNSVVSRGTVLTDIIDDFSDQGTDVTTYEVQDGDNISLIASDYGVKVSTIVWANNLKSADDIKPGMVLKIPPIDGVIHIVQKGDTAQSLAVKYNADADKIIDFNSLPADGSLQIGEEIIIPDGIIKGLPSAVVQQPTAKRFSYLPDLGNYFALPATGYDRGVVHDWNGVDLDNVCGTPIYAAANGVVNLARTTDPTGRTGKKMNGGYGKYIKITHSNGTETLYGHLSKLLVSAGESVQKDEEIGLMGTTGNSTGCHLHFEVHGAKNPLAKY
ncbi:MAG: M23 family metallopeptidase [Minisyncoccia bacterium]